MLKTISKKQINKIPMNKFIQIFVFIISIGYYVPDAYAQTEQTRKDTLSILSFNDFHGAFIPGENMPGAEYFIFKLLELKEHCPNSLILSGGDNFSGSYFSLMSKGEPHQVFTLPTAPDTLISAVGNHEFDWGTEYFLETSTKYVQYVGANIEYKKKSDFKEIVPDYRIVKRGNIHVGIIGLSTPTTTFSGKKPYVNDFEFKKDFSEKVNKLAKELKEKSINVVILLMHIGTDMDDNNPVIHRIDSASENEIKKLSGIDAIVSGHSHKEVCGMFDDTIPMIQAGANGSHIGLIQFEWDGTSTRLITDSLVKVPIPNQIRQSIDSICLEKHFNESCVTVENELIHDRNKNLHEFTDVGGLVTASYKACLDTIRKYRKVEDSLLQNESTPILAVHHFKGIRTGMTSGKLTKAQIGNVLPFGGELAAYRMRGDTVRLLFNEGLDTTKTRGFLQTCDMMFEMIEGKIDKMVLINGDGNDIEITDDMQCIVLCDNFIAYGGDEYKEEYFNNLIKDTTLNKIITTDCFVDYLSSMQNVSKSNTRKSLIINKNKLEVNVDSTVLWKDSIFNIKTLTNPTFHVKIPADIHMECSIGLFENIKKGYYEINNCDNSFTLYFLKSQMKNLIVSQGICDYDCFSKESDDSGISVYEFVFSNIRSDLELKLEEWK